MNSFETFESELGSALQHLYDPDYTPSPLLCTLTACDPSDGPGPVQAVLLETIEGLKPSPEIPSAAAVTVTMTCSTTVLHSS